MTTYFNPIENAETDGISYTIDMQAKSVLSVYFAQQNQFYVDKTAITYRNHIWEFYADPIQQTTYQYRLQNQW